MQIKFNDTPTDYDGTQLRSHWIYESQGLLGNALVSFVGACDVTVENLVDLEDARQDRPIASREMLHFIGEFFDLTLTDTILLQRLLITLLQQRVTEQANGLKLIRTGNDLYDGKFKLSVSIATASPVSTLLHAGINIMSEGTPVPTQGLADYGIATVPFAKQVLQDFKEEFDSISRDLAKVRPVS